MAWSDTEGVLSSFMSPSLSTILIATLIALTIPILLHFTLYFSASKTHLPTFLLIGPRGSGKTSLITLLERGNPAATHTSQTPLTVELSLPITTPPSSSSSSSSPYRSAADPAHQVHKRFLLVDTPGHGKLRHHALDSLVRPQNLKGIIFLVDATDLASSSATGTAADAGLREAAEYLHDVLLLLQKRATTTGPGGKAARGLSEMPVLVAANKLDLFTALPATLVKRALEAEITKVRSSRAKGLLDSGIGMEEMGDVGEERDWLGDGGEGKFEFAQMEEVNVSVTVAGGSVAGAEGADVAKWWEWIGSQL